MTASDEWVSPIPHVIPGPRITSRSNQRVKELRELLSDKRSRDLSGCTVIQGLQPVRQAYEAGAPVRRLVVSEDFRAQRSTISWLATIVRQAPAGGVVLVSGTIFRSLFSDSRPSGIAAAVQIDESPLASVEIDRHRPCTVLVLHGIANAGNLGSILRTANACAVDLVVLVGDTVDLRDPSTARSSMGALFSTAVVRCDTLDEVLAWCARSDLVPVATSVTRGSLQWTGPYPPRQALVFGSERTGLDVDFLSSCSHSVSLPMQGTVESLNLSASVAALLYAVWGSRINGDEL